MVIAGIGVGFAETGGLRGRADLRPYRGSAPGASLLVVARSGGTMCGGGVLEEALWLQPVGEEE